MLPTEATAAFTSNVRELALDPDALQEVTDALNQILSLMDGSDFSYMATIQEESFGANDAATTLAYHHRLAHEVMDDVIAGIKKDVKIFVDNVNKAAEGVEAVDTNAGAELRKKHDVLLGALQNLDKHDSGDAAYNHDRNNLNNVAARPGPSAAPTGGSSTRRAI